MHITKKKTEREREKKKKKESQKNGATRGDKVRTLDLSKLNYIIDPFERVRILARCLVRH